MQDTLLLSVVSLAPMQLVKATVSAHRVQWVTIILMQMQGLVLLVRKGVTRTKLDNRYARIAPLGSMLTAQAGANARCVLWANMKTKRMGLDVRLYPQAISPTMVVLD